MTQIDVLKKTVQAMGATFVYANLFEANKMFDDIKDVQFPCYLHLAAMNVKAKETESGVPNRTLSMFGFWLTKIDKNTDDFSTEGVQPYIDYMSKQAEKMIALLCLDPISEDTGVEEWELLPTYAKFDAGVFGVSVKFDWLTNDGFRVCTTP